MHQPNEVLFYAGTYNSVDRDAIILGALNKDTGEMRILNSTKGIENPSYLAVNSAGTVLYAVSEKDKGEVYAYAIEPGSKALRLLGSRPTDGGAPCYVSISPQEDYIFVSNYSGGNVNIFPVNADGSLQEMSAQVKHEGSGLREDRQEAPHPHSVIPDRSGQHVLVCDLGLDQIVFYRVEAGKLATRREVLLPPGSGPRHLAGHPSGQWLYLINELNSTITVFANDEQSADLKILQSISSLPDHYAAGSDDTAADIHVSPCGRFLYASNRGHDSIALFHIDASTGLLEAQDWVISGGRTPRNFAIIGGMLLAANQNSDNIVSFRIDSETGRLIPTGNELDLTSPVCLKPLNL
ncbi:lactonase family protein [Paenibacillus jilunlii]|uniref:6-phosphogluconolactonase n=1 Tax=Paenibacillus jilunlii TaxID=682956 RepID=A0A1G9ILY8_9BACL|nr:lactonase family protein [Paenibacillus jilunlii]KWX72771.1 6-phosphogluconolactonase [Paenibacillus jilunlii]SDL26278.1 6-phosphogluconolactonase [Paenibacillus jilunlii]